MSKCHKHKPLASFRIINREKVACFSSLNGIRNLRHETALWELCSFSD